MCIMKWRERMKEKCLPIITKGTTVCIAIGDIVKIVRKGRKLEVETDDGTRYAYYEKIENIRKYLDERFYFCLNGCVINLDKVSMMKDLMIQFVNGEQLYIGRDSFIRARRRYNSFATQTD